MSFSNKNFLVLAAALVAVAIVVGVVLIQRPSSAPSGPYAQAFQSRQNSPQPLTITPAEPGYTSTNPPPARATVDEQSRTVGGDEQSAQAVGYQPESARSRLDPCGSNSEGYSRRANYVDDAYYSSVRRPVYVHRTGYIPPQSSFVDRTSSRYVDRRSTSGPVYRNDIRQGRSKKKSAVIVAGTAGVGAAIGAVAAGGKGAALGGLSGGAAGFLYDRLTHNH